MQLIDPWRAVVTAVLGTALVSGGSWAQAQRGYSLNGYAAPQVQPNPVAATLEAQLRSLKGEFEARAQSVSLQQAIETGLLNNPRLAESYAQIQGGQWNLIAVRRQWYPSLNVGTGASPGLVGQAFSTSTRISSSSSVSTTTYFNRTNAGVGLVLNWSFFDLSRGPSINAASEALAQQRFLFDVTARNLVLETQLAYFSLQEQRQLIRAYEEILAATDRQVALTEAQFNDGMVSIADVEQIRTQQYGTLSILIGVYRQLFDSAALVAQLMALPPGTLVLSADDLSVLGAWGQPLPSTISQALKLREEIKASLAASASASWTATSLFNQYWPQFSLGANGNYFGDSVASGAPGASLAAIDRSSQLNWSGGVGIGFNWQLFDGGINAAQAESSKALARQFLNRAAVERLNVTREVEQAYTSYVTSQLVTQSASEQVASARKAVVAVEERFRVGVTDMATVVQTLTQAILAANAYATAVRTYNVSVANLYRSSARWPDGVQPLLERRVGALQRQ